MTNETNGHILCTPGDRICEATDAQLGGDGTYTFNDYIYASVVGKVDIIKKGNITFIKVSCGYDGSKMPEVNSLVTGRVLNVTPNQTTVAILAVQNQMLHTPFQGTIKKINTRKHKVDQVQMYDCFRPSDIVIAKVLSLGGVRSYELSTAENTLGVVSAHCEENHSLIPDSWTTMKCPCRTEKRKVASVVPSEANQVKIEEEDEKINEN